MGRKRKTSKNDNYYVDPEELKKELKYFKETDIITDELGIMLHNIAHRFASTPNWGYSFKEDFVSDAIYRMIEQLHKIDLEHPKCNPFAYLTQTCYYKFIAKIASEKKYQKIKESLKDYYFDDFEQNEDIGKKSTTNDDEDYECENY